MNIAKQFGALLRMSLSGIPARLGLVGTIVVGVACAVGRGVGAAVCVGRGVGVDVAGGLCVAGGFGSPVELG